MLGSLGMPKSLLGREGNGASNQVYAGVVRLLGER